MGFGKGALLWLIGIPLPIIILLALFWRWRADVPRKRKRLWLRPEPFFSWTVKLSQILCSSSSSCVAGKVLKDALQGE